MPLIANSHGRSAPEALRELARKQLPFSHEVNFRCCVAKWHKKSSSLWVKVIMRGLTQGSLCPFKSHRGQYGRTSPGAERCGNTCAGTRQGCVQSSETAAALKPHVSGILEAALCLCFHCEENFRHLGMESHCFLFFSKKVISGKSSILEDSSALQRTTICSSHPAFCFFLLFPTDAVLATLSASGRMFSSVPHHLWSLSTGARRRAGPASHQLLQGSSLLSSVLPGRASAPGMRLRFPAHYERWVTETKEH